MKRSKTEKNTTLLSIKVFTAMEHSKILKQLSLYDLCHGENTGFF